MNLFRPLFPAITLCVWLAGCANHDQAGEPAPASAPLSVHAAAATSQPWPETYEATGTVRARVSVPIASKVLGYVREVNVQAGETVRSGQVLVVLDGRDLELSVRSAEAERTEAKNSVPEADNAVTAAEASLSLARSTHRRINELFEKTSVSNQEMDEATAKLRQAEANRQIALSRRRQLDARIAHAEEAVASAKVMLAYARITAPFSGIVTQRTVDPGVLAMPGVPLLTLEQTGAYRLEVPVEESRLPLVRRGQPVAVTLDATPNPVQGRIGEIVPAVDTASHSFLVKIDLPPAMHLRSGLFGRASFAAGQRAVVSVPVSAIAEEGQIQSVFVAANGKVSRRIITLGRTRDGRLEVLSGLAAADLVINPVPSGLRDGAPVEVRP